MSTPLDDDTLQRYYDGELSPAEERDVQAEVDADPELQQRIAALSQLTEWMQTAAEDVAAGVDSDALFASIQADVAQQKRAGFGESFQVVGGEVVEHKKSLVVPAASALAVAAAALLVFMGSEPSDPPADTKVAQQQAAPTQQPAQAAVAAVQGTEIENVDFGNQTGTVFEIETRGITTAVVWIADDEEEEEEDEVAPSPTEGSNQ